MKNTMRNCMHEWTLVSSKVYADPSAEAELDGIVTDTAGKVTVVPGFWAGGNEWKIRFASSAEGRFTIRSRCSDPNNKGLNGLADTLEVVPYTGSNPLLLHGPLRVAASGRTLEHRDGTPFFWLGDTWWYGLVRDFAWPDEFKELTAERVRKGFSLIQIVVGYVPAMPEGEVRCGNEAGLPWGADYRGLNPGYFDLADVRLGHLVESGLVPCIVGSWGCWLHRLGVEKAKRHWRYLVARYGAYPVVWCLCGELQTMYKPLAAEDRAELQRQRQFLKEGWSQVCRYLAQIDPYGHSLTAHPDSGHESREMLENDSPVTLAMLQTSHSPDNLPSMFPPLLRARDRRPPLPVINGECLYEGIFGCNGQETQRFALWSCLLSGAAGHTYGAAEGCWQIHHRGRPSVPLTSGPWGKFEDWREIAAYPGSGQMQYARRLFERYDWWRFAPHPEWMKIEEAKDGALMPQCAGIPGRVRIFYLPPPLHVAGRLTSVVGLEKGTVYQAHSYDPRFGTDRDLGAVRTQNGAWSPPSLPNNQDWVIVLETKKAKK